MEISIIQEGRVTHSWEFGIKKVLGANCFKVAEVRAGEIMRNKKLRNQVVVVLGMSLLMATAPNLPVFAAVGPDRIGALGNRFWSYVKIIAKWGCICCGGLDVLRNLNTGDVKGIWKVALKYIVAYAVIVGLPWMFEEVDKFFV